MMVVALGDRRPAMDAVIDFVLGHQGALFLVALGIGVILYSSFAKRMSFQGDFPLGREERETYEATPTMRKYGITLGILPLLYGLHSLFFR
jgi:hypothetical protein